MCQNHALSAKEKATGVNEGWPVVTYLNFGHANASALERIFLVSQSSYYLCNYNYEFEEVSQHQRVDLYQVNKIQKVRFATKEYGLKITFGHKEYFYNQNSASAKAAPAGTTDEVYVENSEGDEKYHVIRPKTLGSSSIEKTSEG